MSRLVRMLMLALVAMSAMTVVPAEVATAQAAGTLSGRVYRQADNSGVLGAVVCIERADTNDGICDRFTFTNQNGNYSFSNLAPTTYLVGAVNNSSPVPTAEDEFYFPGERPIVVGQNPAVADFYVPIPRFIPSKTEEIAHRGDRVSSPENTMEAFRRAINKGATFTEVDVLLASDNSVLVAHGSRYLDEDTVVGFDVNNPLFLEANLITQIYGPTNTCFDRNLEADTNLQTMLANCDIGSEMMILPGKTLGNTWVPKFRNARYMRLDDVLRAFPQYCGWMIELKKSELANQPARDYGLGQAVQAILLREGYLSRCTDKAWVTSFSDDALEGVTNPAIKKMRNVAVSRPRATLNFPRDWAKIVDGAVWRGYDALNIDINDLNLAVTRRVYAPGAGFANVETGQTVIEYVRRAGLMVSAYALTGRIVTYREQTPGMNQAAIDRKADFFMTDILDDMQARNGDRRPPYHAARLLNDFKPGPDKAIIQSQEVYTSEVNPRALTSASERFLLTKFTLPAQGVAALSRPTATSGNLTLHFTVPRYADNNYTPSYQSYTTTAVLNSQAATSLDGGQKLEVGGNHAVWTNVDPILWLGKDDVTFKANGLEFPHPSGANIAIVGNQCGTGRAENVVIQGRLKPATGWTIKSMKLKLDNTTIASYTGAAIADKLLQASDQDIPPGNHTFKIEATLFYDNVLYSQDTNNPSDDITRVEVYEQPFVTRAKPCTDPPWEESSANDPAREGFFDEWDTWIDNNIATSGPITIQRPSVLRIWLRDQFTWDCNGSDCPSPGPADDNDLTPQLVRSVTLQAGDRIVIGPASPPYNNSYSRSACYGNVMDLWTTIHRYRYDSVRVLSQNGTERFSINLTNGIYYSDYNAPHVYNNNPNHVCSRREQQVMRQFRSEYMWWDIAAQ